METKKLKLCSRDSHEIEEDVGDSPRKMLLKSEENPFEIINDDCLFHIFSFLSIQDRCKLSLVCRRFSEVAELILRTLKKLDLMELEELKLQPACNVLNKIGKNLTTVVCRNRYRPFSSMKSMDEKVESLPRFCPNIKCIRFSLVYSEHKTYEKFVNIFTNLTSLALIHCSLDDTTCSVLKNCKNLQHLDLSFNHGISGKHLNSLTKLKTLNIGSCLSYKPIHFRELCKVNKLTELNILYCYELDKRSLETLLETQTDLEKLTISNSLATEDLRDVVKLPNLRDLRLRGSFGRTSISDFLRELVNYKSKNLKSLTIDELPDNEKDVILNMIELEELRINSLIDDVFLAELAIRIPNIKKLGCRSCFRLSNDAVLAYIVKNKLLEFIDLQSCFEVNFTPEFVLNLIDALKIENRPRPLKILVHNSLSLDAETERLFDRNRLLLNLIFDTSHDTEIFFA